MDDGAAEVGPRAVEDRLVELRAGRRKGGVREEVGRDLEAPPLEGGTEPLAGEVERAAVSARALLDERHAFAAVEEEDHGPALPGFPVEGRHRAGEEDDDGDEGQEPQDRQGRDTPLREPPPGEEDGRGHEAEKGQWQAQYRATGRSKVNVSAIRRLRGSTCDNGTPFLLKWIRDMRSRPQTRAVEFLAGQDVERLEQARAVDDRLAARLEAFSLTSIAYNSWNLLSTMVMLPA